MNNKTNGPNYVKHNHVVNDNVWVMDETALGTVRIFFIYNLNSHSIIGWILNSPSVALDAEQIQILLQRALDNCSLEQGNPPRILHGDQAPIYSNKKFQAFLKEQNITFSCTTGYKNSNQAIESLHNSFKSKFMLKLFDLPTHKAKKEMLATLTPKQKKMSLPVRAKNKEVRKNFFNSHCFLLHYKNLVKPVVEELNERKNVDYQSFTNQQVEFFVQRIIPDQEPVKLVKRTSLEAQNLILNRTKTFNLLHQELYRIENLPQDQQQDALDRLFIKDTQILVQLDGMARMNFLFFTKILQESEDMKKQNEEIKKQNSVIETELQTLQQQLSITNEKLLAREKELQEKRERRDKVKNRKREELNNPILREHYDLLMHKIGFKQTFFKARLRLALTVLFLTGMRISEIRNIRLQDLKSLFTSERPHIKYQTAKKGAPRTAFLTPIGKELIKERKKDFEFIFEWQDENYLTPIFGDSKTFEPCGREHTNKTINKEIQYLNKKFSVKFTSHSFRRGYITQLWKNTGDIYFVQQAIGHSKIETTARYINKLSPQEIADRMESIENDN